MRRKTVILIVCLGLFLALFTRSFAQDEDDDSGYPEYPDGSYGVDLGDDWQVMPEGGGMKFIGDQATRGEYVDTANYGPMTETGFEVFPEFRWSGPASQAAEKKEKARMYYIYYEATTAPPEIPGEMPPEGKGKKAKEKEIEGRYIGAGKSGPGD